MPELIFHPVSVEILDHEEGFQEFRCIPAHWTYRSASLSEHLFAEAYSCQVHTDEDPDFWSASDAVMRTRQIEPKHLDVREMTLMATRRSLDYNAPAPWAAHTQAVEMDARWVRGHRKYIHPFSALRDDEGPGLWNHYGMTSLGYEADKLQLYTGYSIQSSQRTLPSPTPWLGGIGTYYSWSTLMGWEVWPTRQAVVDLASSPEAGKLLLFISHRWEDLTHPDPSGRQLLALKVGLTLALAALIRQRAGYQTSSGLPELFKDYILSTHLINLNDPALVKWAKRVKQVASKSKAESDLWAQLQSLENEQLQGILESVRQSVLVWYDYTSMYQQPRSPEEEQEFRRELLLLNEIQAPAATTIIAGNAEYESRGWCFLEMCGAVRHRVVELTPSWGSSIDIHSSLTKWANITDQLIGALIVHGLEAIQGTELRTTHPEDLEVVATLISKLPLFGLVESDGSDLIGGALPLPFRSGCWVIDSPRHTQEDDDKEELPALAPLPDFGRVPDSAALNQIAEQMMRTQTLDGECAIWVYTSQRLLSLAWAARAAELHRLVGSVCDIGALGAVTCAWADSRALADDGVGWTRYIPSSARMLIIVTQVALPQICLLYDQVLRSHLAAGVTVITLMPDTGRATIHRPPAAQPANASHRPAVGAANVLAVPRIRRSTAFTRYLLLPTGIRREDIAVLGALRLDPSQGHRLGVEIPPDTLAVLSKRRILTEGQARTKTASWEEYALDLLNLETWQDTRQTTAQLALIDAMVKKAARFSENPIWCREALYTVLKYEGTQPLTPGVLRALDALLREQQRPSKGSIKESQKPIKRPRKPKP